MTTINHLLNFKTIFQHRYMSLALMAMLVPALLLTSCSKEKPVEDDPPTNQPKYLVRTYSYAQQRYVYDSQGRITDEYIYEKLMDTYAYANNLVTHRSSNGYTWGESYMITDNDGRALKTFGAGPDTTYYSYQNGYLSKMTVIRHIGNPPVAIVQAIRYYYQDGNLVKVIDSIPDGFGVPQVTCWYYTYYMDIKNTINVGRFQGVGTLNGDFHLKGNLSKNALRSVRVMQGDTLNITSADSLYVDYDLDELNRIVKCYSLLGMVYTFTYY